MKLIIDIGNSGTKLAIYDGGNKVAFCRTDAISPGYIMDVIEKYEPDKAIVSSVKDIPGFLGEILGRELGCYHLLSSGSVLPFKVNYETRDTLGADRLASVAGATIAFPGSDILVIDAGTAITFDVLCMGEYMGGAISPGIDMRFSALNIFTGRLPKVKRSETVSFPARTTESSINAGVISGVVFEINEYIRTFVTKHPDMKVILTGGDGAFLKDLISGNVVYLPDIVTDGLNFILDNNAE